MRDRIRQDIDTAKENDALGTRAGGRRGWTVRIEVRKTRKLAPKDDGRHQSSQAESAARPILD